MKEKEQRTHKLAMEIVKLLIDSGLSINDQLKVINDVREKLLFCKKTGQEMKQLTLFQYIMNGSKEYFLKLSEQTYNELPDGVKLSLNHLGMEVRQLPTENDLEDENYKKIRKHRIDAWNQEQEYLFKKRNK